MKKGKPQFKILIIIFGFSFLFSPLFVYAQENILENFIENTPLVNAELIPLVFNIIRYVLGFLGVVAVVILIYGGFLWMTAGGNEEKVRKAKKTLINGLIGLIIILLSFGIVQFVIGPLLRGGVSGGEIGGGEKGEGISPSGRNYLVITSKYPKPNSTIARNNKIIITFNQNLEEDSVKLARPKDNDPQKTDCVDWTVAIKTNNNFLDGSLKVIGNALIFLPEQECPEPVKGVKCDKGKESKCFLELTPDGCCGCFPSGSIEVFLKGGENGLKGTRTSGNKLASDINWNFNVGNYLETNPPSVENNLPQGENVSRNVGISVIFSKEIDLSTLKVYNPNCKIGSTNCNVANCGTNNCLNYAVDDINEATVKVINNNNNTPIPGFFERLSTKAFLFRPINYCPSPAQNCRCFPENTKITVELTDKIKDVNCNNLDCQNGKCSWQFTSSDKVDLTPPEVKSTDPIDNATGIDRLSNISVTFNEPMDPTSINEDTFVLRPEMLPREIAGSSSNFVYKPYRVLEAQTRYTSIIFGGGLPKGSCQLDPNSVFGVKDLAGNAMIENYLFSFTTSHQVSLGNPYIDWVSPNQGPIGQCVTIHGYNLGCCLNNPCLNNEEKPAQNNKWTGTTCQEVKNPGKVEFCSEFDENGNCLKHIEAEVLVWREINQPETSCLYGYCPANCSFYTCESGCEKCLIKPDCQNLGNNDCCCPYPLNYSPENEIIVRVPQKAINRLPNKPGQIKVTPAY